MRGRGAGTLVLLGLALAGCLGLPGAPGGDSEPGEARDPRDANEPGEAGEAAGNGSVAVPLVLGAVPPLPAAVRWTHQLPQGDAREAPLASPLLADVDGDGVLDVVQGHGEEFRSVLDAPPERSLGGVVALSGRNGSLLWRADLGAVDASPAWGDVTGSSQPGLVVGLRSRLSLAVLDPGNGSVVAELPLENWVHSPALVDLDGDHALEAVVTTGGHEGGAKGPGKPGELVVAGRGGETGWDAPLRAPVGQEAYASPAVGRLAAPDGAWVAVLGTGGQLAPGGSVQARDLATGALRWREETDTGVLSSPVLADLDGDGGLDAVVLTWWGGVLARSLADGRPLWDAATATLMWTSPAVGDLDGDGRPDVVATGYVTEDLHFRGFEQEVNGKFSAAYGTGGIVAAWDGASGRPLWLRQLGNATPANPVTADVTGDGRAEVLLVVMPGEQGFFGAEGLLLALQGRDGAAVGAMALGGAAVATPAVGDVDGDGRPEVAVATVPGEVKLIGFEAEVPEPAVAWAYPRWRGNERGTGMVEG